MLESIYYCSGIVVAICAVIALIQLIISKHQLESERKSQKTQLEREAQKYAIEQIAYFNNEIVPIENQIYRKRDKNHISLFDDSIIKIQNDKIVIERKYDKTDHEKIKQIIPELVRIINCLEIYSSVLISGLANETFVFQLQADDFFRIVEKYLPFISDNSGNNQKLSAIEQLYILWKTRSNKKEIIIEKEKLETVLNNIAERSISVIGINT